MSMKSHAAPLSYTESHNKSDIKTKKDDCGTARHFHDKCYHSFNPFVYLCVQLIEKVYCIYDDCNIEDILWDKSMNSISDLYFAKSKSCRKH